LDLLVRREKDPRAPAPSGLVICRAEDDDATKEIVSRLASRGSPPELTMPVINMGCRLERICGNIAGVDCKSAIDGPYDYFDMTDWRSVAQCGGRCRGGQCTNCPPKELKCPNY